MNWEALFAGLAALMALLALLMSVMTLRSVAWTANMQALSDLEREMGNNPGFLKFHGIDPSELEAKGITPQEFAYLLASFSIGGIYFRAGLRSLLPERFSKLFSKKLKPFDRHSYRYKMCKSEKVQQAWPLLKQVMLEDEYFERIDLTIEEIKQSQPSCEHVE